MTTAATSGNEIPFRSMPDACVVFMSPDARCKTRADYACGSSRCAKRLTCRAGIVALLFEQITNSVRALSRTCDRPRLALLTADAATRDIAETKGAALIARQLNKFRYYIFCVHASKRNNIARRLRESRFSPVPIIDPSTREMSSHTANYYVLFLFAVLPRASIGEIFPTKVRK